MTRAYFSSLPPLKQKLWANFHDYERALVATDRKINVSEKAHVSLRIVEIYDFAIFFFIFTLLLLFRYISLITIITFLDSLVLNANGNIKLRSRTKFQLYCKRTYRVACKTLNWDMRKPFTLGSTLGLILNCFVKHYGSKFLISEQDALCFIGEPYYDCFLVP